ncbi:MAG: 2-oxo acid dehydrogenase subunit E2 [Chloroflexi bacterium]|nr:2-oxo acid dehydrogenase subunit E2 [Chloroflexota bacterium]
MATAVKMPQLGMTMTEAKIVRWLTGEGDRVTKGEPVAQIETDKLNAEVDAPADGILARIVAAEGETVPVVGLMAVVAAEGESEAAVEAVVQGSGVRGQGPVTAPPLPLGEGARSPHPGPFAEGEGARSPYPGPFPGGEGMSAAAVAADRTSSMAEVRASPIARRLAAGLGVDLSGIAGTGPGGRIVEADVRAAARPPLPLGEGWGEGGRAPATLAAEAAAVGIENGYVRASPIAKRLAREHRIELHAIRGTGPEGRVIERDVLAALEAQERAARVPAVAAPGLLTPRETIKLDGIRRLIAERMQRSLAESAQLTLTAEADATALVELRGHLVPAARVYGHRPPTYTDLLVGIVARVLRSHPLLNSSLQAANGVQEIVCWSEINVGVAVALERGLIVPVVRGADQKPLQVISEELGDLAERARANRLSVDDLQGGTFTITNLGQVEVDAFTPIVNPPQCAILGVGRIAKKPAVYQDQLAIRHLVTLSLSFDHRIVDGYPAGAFLRDVKRAIEAAAVGDETL